MHNILIEDITSLALLYFHRADYNCKMITKEKVENYKRVVDANLDEMNSPVDGVHPVDFSESIYFNVCDENGIWYSILKPNLDIEKAELAYIYRMPYDIIQASQQDNALEVLGLQLLDGKIVKKEKLKTKLLINNNFNKKIIKI